MLRGENDIARDTIMQCLDPVATGQDARACGRSRYARLCALLSLATLGLLGPLPVSAQPGEGKPAPGATAQYEELLDRAVSAFEAADHARAHDLFREAYALRPNARVSRGLGITALRLERYTEARRWLSAALTDKNQPLTSAQRDEVTKLIAWMDSSLGLLRLQWSPAAPPDHELWVDEQRTRELVLWLTPGQHRVRARAPEHEPHEDSVELVAGREQTLTLALRERPRPVAPPASVQRADMVSPAAAAQSIAPLAADGGEDKPAPAPLRDSPGLLSRWWFWTAVGVVVAGGVTAGVLLANKPHEVRDYEPGGEGGVILSRGVLP